MKFLLTRVCLLVQALCRVARRGKPAMAQVSVLFMAMCLAVSGAERPNVVLIIADDQSYGDFGFMGNGVVKTPALDRLAGQSAVYRNGYLPISVCRPSLATLLTGLYPHEHGIHFNHPPPGNSALGKLGGEAFNAARAKAEYLIKAVATLPRVLAGQGYRCFQSGKHWEGSFEVAGFTEGMTKAVASDESKRAYGNKVMGDGSVVAHGNGDAGLGIGREGLGAVFDFIDEVAGDGAEGGEPFMVWYAPFLPHTPHDSPGRFRDLYKEAVAAGEMDEYFVPYYASISQFDETVGQLVDYVEAKGLAGETVFVFVSDNGWQPIDRVNKKAVGEYVEEVRTKRSPFDKGLRTPIMIRYDGVVKAGVHDGVCSSVDIVPTVLSALGLEGAMGELPGVDLMASAKGEEVLESRAVFGEIYPGDATSLGYPSRDLSYRWVRSSRYKLIVPHEDAKGVVWRGKEYVSERALFDVVDDLDERVNLMGDAKYAGIAIELEKLLDDWWTGEEDSKTAKPVK